MALWLEFQPLGRVDGSSLQLLVGRHPRRLVRDFFVRDDGSGTPRLDDLIQERIALRTYCLDPESFGRPDPKDPCGLIGRQLVAACEHREREGRLPECWRLMRYVRTPEAQAIHDYYARADRRNKRRRSR